MIPSLAVTEEQAAAVLQMARQQQEDRELVARSGLSGVMLRSLTLRLPERPTMPADPACYPGHPDYCVIPIPDGAEVRIGWRGVDVSCFSPVNTWHHIATATLVSVRPVFVSPQALLAGRDDHWAVALADLKLSEE